MEEVYFDHYQSRNEDDFPDFLQITICKEGEKCFVMNIDNVDYEQAKNLFNNIIDKESYAHLGFGEL